jgi:hypothetical protein
MLHAIMIECCCCSSLVVLLLLLPLLTLPTAAAAAAAAVAAISAVFDQDLAQELPLEQTALAYVSEVARRHDPNLPLEKVRQALGALGLTGPLPLQVTVVSSFGLTGKQF